jgi:hypothetical protein
MISSKMGIISQVSFLGDILSMYRNLSNEVEGNPLYCPSCETNDWTFKQ